MPDPDKDKVIVRHQPTFLGLPVRPDGYGAGAPPSLEELDARLRRVEEQLGRVLGSCNYTELCTLTQVVGRMGALVEDLRTRCGSGAKMAGQIGMLQADVARLIPIVEMLQRNLRRMLPEDR